jgi:homoserine kinase
VSEREAVRAFAPASVSNVGCGFDVFGFAVAGPGDVVEARRREEPGVVVAAITGAPEIAGRLPRDPAKNTAAVAAARLLEIAAAEGARVEGGVELRLEKGMPLGSGLGSSAASGVAAAVAVDALLGLGASRETLLAAAVAGEAAAAGAPHADNAAPSLWGGFVLVRPGVGAGGGGGDPLRPRVTPLPVPAGLACALVRPHLEVETRAARAALGTTVPLAAAVVHWGNTAALVAGLFRADDALIGGALEDLVAEPVRARAVPGFAAVKAAALAAGALGCSLSGSGPTLFALCRGLDLARRVAAAMGEALAAAAGLAGDVFTSPVGAPGARILEPEPPPGGRS